MFPRSKRNLILISLLAIISAVLFFVGQSLEFKAAPFLFRKLASLKALFYFPDWKNETQIGQNSSLDQDVWIDGGDFLEALVILRPPAIAHDQLIVNKGFKDGVMDGQLVVIDDSVIVGKVGEVFEDSSRVISFSSYGLEQNVFLQQAGISATALGFGNNELIITLPRDFPVSVGDKAVSLTSQPYLVGIIESIDLSPSSPLKTLRIKQPFNIYHLRSVNILP